MKQLAVKKAIIKNFWKSEGLCHLEFWAPVWSGGITMVQARDLTRLSDYSSEVWIFTLETSLEVHRNMFRHKPRATVGLIFFTFLIQMSEKQ